MTLSNEFAALSLPLPFSFSISFRAFAFRPLALGYFHSSILSLIITMACNQFTTLITTIFICLWPTFHGIPKCIRSFRMIVRCARFVYIEVNWHSINVKRENALKSKTLRDTQRFQQ